MLQSRVQCWRHYCFNFSSMTESEEESTSYLQREDFVSDCSSVSYFGLSHGIDKVFSSVTRHSRNYTEECVVKFAPTVHSRLSPEVICLPSSSLSTVNSSFQESCQCRIWDAQPATKLEDVPGTVNCTSCGIQVITCIEYRASDVNWALAGLLCSFGCHLGCCLVPVFVKSVKDVVHICPLCKTQLGKYCKG